MVLDVAGKESGGEAGIRTLGRGFSPYNGLANRRLPPLGHLTRINQLVAQITSGRTARIQHLGRELTFLVSLISRQVEGNG